MKACYILIIKMDVRVNIQDLFKASGCLQKMAGDSYEMCYLV